MGGLYSVHARGEKYVRQLRFFQHMHHGLLALFVFRGEPDVESEVDSEEVRKKIIGHRE